MCRTNNGVIETVEAKKCVGKMDGQCDQIVRIF